MSDAYVCRVPRAHNAMALKSARPGPAPGQPTPASSSVTTPEAEAASSATTNSVQAYGRSACAPRTSAAAPRVKSWNREVNISFISASMI